MEEKKQNNTKSIIITAAIAFIVGALIMFLLYNFVFTKNKVVATIKGFKVTKADLYDDMKVGQGLSSLLKKVDSEILRKKYKLTDEMKKEAEEEANSYLEEYKNYGYSEEEFYEAYGLAGYEQFVEELEDSRRQELYFADYMANIIGEDAIQEYYNSGVIYGPIECKHILVYGDENPEQAKERAIAIINELNSGITWDEIVEKYVDEETTIQEDLGNVKFDNGFEESFANALVAMENNTYSKEPVETSYGYHVIYRGAQGEKPSLEEARTSIVNVLAATSGEDVTALQYKAMTELEKEYKLKIKDKLLNDQYNEFIESIK